MLNPRLLLGPLPQKTACSVIGGQQGISAAVSCQCTLTACKARRSLGMA